MEENKIQQQLDEILEIVLFIKDNAASKEDIKDMATKADIAELKADIQSLKSDLDDIKIRLARLEAKFEILEKRDREDSGAFASDILDFKKRLLAAEKNIVKLQRQVV